VPLSRFLAFLRRRQQWLLGAVLAVAIAWSGVELALNSYAQSDIDRKCGGIVPTADVLRLSLADGFVEGDSYGPRMYPGPRCLSTRLSRVRSG
jgi:hypothetical protein